MKNKDIEKNLSQAVSQMVPEDMFERISLKLTPAPQKERTSMIMTVNSNKNKMKKAVSLVIAASLVIAIGLFGFTYYSNNIAVESVIDIDVNPSVELTTNKKDRVIDAVAVNDDAVKILEGMDLKDADLDVAINALIGSMLQNGYLDNADNGILVTVQNSDERKAKELRNIVLSDIDESLANHNVEAKVSNQTLTDTANAEEFAKANNISVGKASLVLGLAEKDSTLKAEVLAKKSLKEIADTVKDKNIDISDLVDYDADDSIWENIADEVEDRNENAQENKTQSASNADLITAAKAKEIALNHAGVAADKATFIKAELDKDDGVKKYEIEFKVENVEYEYEINATSGRIIKSEKDIDKDYVKAANNNQTQAASTGTITSDKAKEIALNHAGVKAADAKYIKAEYDYDDGVRKYDVEFTVGNTEYDYEINAANGNIIKAEKDIDDDYKKPVTTTTKVTTTKAAANANSDVISLAKAKEIALNHAGVKADDATFVKAKLDKDDGVQVYEIEFCIGRVDYEFEINAKTGAIIDYEKDFDD